MNNVEPEIIKNRNTAKNDFDENIFLKSLTEIFDLVIPNANNIKMKGSTSKIVIFVLTANPKDIELKIIYLYLYNKSVHFPKKDNHQIQ